MNEVTNLTNDQVEFARSCVIKWMQICRDNNVNYDIADAHHSTLLGRLFAGGKIYDQPPPKRFSYPAWELMEYEEVGVVEVFDSAHGGVCVDQHLGYSWIDKEKGILRYDRLNIEYQYYERDEIPKYIPEDKTQEEMKFRRKYIKRI